MHRLTLPSFIHEVVDDPRQRGILIAGSLALFSVGLVPRVLSPGLPTAQEAIKLQPEVHNLFLLLAFVSTTAVILGGLAGDLIRRRWLMTAGLATMAVGAVVSLLATSGMAFYVANFLAVGASGIVLAYGIGSVAVAYEGIPRATALGVVYAAFGAGSAAAPALLTSFPQLIPSLDPAVPPSFTFDTRLAYLLTAMAAAVALWAARRWIPAIPGNLPARPSLVTSIAFWSIAILAVVSGVLGVLASGPEPLPLLLIAAGGIVLGTLSFGFRRVVAGWGELRLDQRGVGAALSVGVAVGFAQAVPLMLLPTVFQFPLRYGQWPAMFAIVPFALALLVAGPVSGILIRRYGPRGMMTLGTLGLGLANIILAAALIWIVNSIRAAFAADPSGASNGLHAAQYVLFILPLVLIGAGFVLATTVRTAIVFASTPRGLPASAAAINEASVGLGSRIGIVVATSALTLAAVGSARDMAAGLAGADALVAEFQDTLAALGTPRFAASYQASLLGAAPIKAAAYSIAYLDGAVTALLISGVAGVGGALLAWLLMGRRDPIESVFDMQDERVRGVERG